MATHKKKPDIELSCHLCGKKYMASYRAKTTRKYCDECRATLKKSAQKEVDKRRKPFYKKDSGITEGDHVYC